MFPPPKIFHSLIAFVFPSEICWELTRELEAEYIGTIFPEVNRILEGYFDLNSDCRLGFFSIKRCMIGKMRDKAKPTVLLVGGSQDTWKGAKKALQLENFEFPDRRPHWQLKCRSEFPYLQGTSSHPSGIERFEFLSSSKPTTWYQGDNSHGPAADVYFDLRPYKRSAKRIRCTGLAIYVDHEAGLRPATANFVRVGEQILLQTVYHAFHRGTYMRHDRSTSQPPEGPSLLPSIDELTRIGCLSVWSEARDWALVKISDKDMQFEMRLVLSENERAFFAFLDAQEPFESAAERPSSMLRKEPSSMLAQGPFGMHNAAPSTMLARRSSGMLARILYGMPAENSRKRHERCWTWTASMGRCEVIISETSNHVKLPHSNSFEEVYEARLVHGSWSNGDSGAVIMSIQTNLTFGHVIGGNRTTGVALVLAANQVVKDFRGLASNEFEDLKATAKSGRAEIGGSPVNATLGYHSGVPACSPHNFLHQASLEGNEDLVKKLLDRKVDVKAENGIALSAASRRGHKQIVEILLKEAAVAKADSIIYGSALIAASDGGHEQIVEMLLDAGANVNAAFGESNDTPLEAAARRGHEQIVEILLEKGAEVNAKSGIYGSALLAAFGGGYKQVVSILLSAGADLGARGAYGYTPLMLAAKAGHKAMVEHLLSIDTIDRDSRDDSGLTALSFAALKQHRDVADCLSSRLQDRSEAHVHRLTIMRLVLKDRHVLRAFLKNSQSLEPYAEIDLDGIIGNDDGVFKWNWHKYSHSARDISMDIEGERVLLRAQLKRSGKKGYSTAQLDLSEHLLIRRGQIQHYQGAPLN